jgi:dienelactone hydrolase
MSKEPVPHAPLSAYEKTSFTGPLEGEDLFTADLYVRAPEGVESPPSVIVIQELPGIMPETLRLCDKLVEAGFRVYLPHLFGPLGKTSFIGNTFRLFCMRKEFSLFAANKSSPIVNWLKALARMARDETGARGVGAIGMCLTGNFAISMMADDAVLAGVAAQPSMPLGGHAALHMSGDEIETVKAKLDQVGPMHAYRFEGDNICRGVKFETLAETFNEGGAERIKLTTLPGPGHSVLTGHFVDKAGHPTHEALTQVIGYFRGQLA